MLTRDEARRIAANFAKQSALPDYSDGEAQPRSLDTRVEVDLLSSNGSALGLLSYRAHSRRYLRPMQEALTTHLYFE